jgi:hypothetical protein
MQTCAFLVSVFIALSLAQPSHAAPTAKPSPVPAPVAVTPTGPAKRVVAPEKEWKPWSIGLVVGYMDYKEPGLMREYGPLYGANGSFTLLTESNLQWNFEGEFLGGKLLYDGGSQAGARYTKPTTDWILNTRVTAGLYKNMTPTWSVTPFAGFGFRVLNDKIEGSGSYNRNISYVYFPLGAQLAGFVTHDWSLSFAADLDIMVYGTVISRLSDVDPDNPDITNHNKGLGGRLIATVRKDMGLYAIHAGAIYQKWKIDESDGVKVTIGNQTGILSEPANEFDFFGLNLGADF